MPFIPGRADGAMKSKTPIAVSAPVDELTVPHQQVGNLIHFRGRERVTPGGWSQKQVSRIKRPGSYRLVHTNSTQDEAHNTNRNTKKARQSPGLQFTKAGISPSAADATAAPT